MASTSPSRGWEGVGERVRNKQGDSGRESTLWDNTYTSDPALTVSHDKKKHTKKKVCWRAFYEPPKKGYSMESPNNVVFVPFSSELFVTTSRIIKLY